MTELLLLVDKEDRIVGYGEKLETHVKKKLHRAFSVFIIDRTQHKILIQKRANGKYHSGGLWSNSCCSHWRKDETIAEAIVRCVAEELGIILSENLTIVENPMNDMSDDVGIYAGKFQYFSDYGTLAESEIDYVYIIFVTDKLIEQIRPNQDEVETIRFINPEELKGQLESNPQIFTSWFKEAYHIALRMIENF